MKSPAAAALSEPPSIRGLRYERPAVDLHRFAESPLDERFREFAESYARLDEAGRTAATAALEQDDCYRLFVFARRCVLRWLRGEPGWLGAARSGLSAVNRERVDYRDLEWASGIVSWAEEGGRAAALAKWGFQVVEGREGPVLFSGFGGASTVSPALVDTAYAVQDLLEADAYRVREMGLSSMRPIWLTGEDAVQALAGVRGGISLSGSLDPSVFEHARSQHTSAWVLEAADEDAATAIAAGAQSRTGVEELGSSSGAVCCVIVARSWVEGKPAYEHEGSLERFAPGLEAALAA